MASFVVLWQYTPQGIARIQDTVKRSEAAKALATKMGIKVTELAWLMGAYDGILVADAPDAETMAAYCVSLGKLGNIRTTTLRAFRAGEVEKILGKVQ
jgi:uncharacterized protein with GYD domain